MNAGAPPPPPQDTRDTHRHSRLLDSWKHEPAEMHPERGRQGGTNTDHCAHAHVVTREHVPSRRHPGWTRGHTHKVHIPRHTWGHKMTHTHIHAHEGRCRAPVRTHVETRTHWLSCDTTPPPPHPHTKATSTQSQGPSTQTLADPEARARRLGPTHDCPQKRANARYTWNRGDMKAYRFACTTHPATS